MKGSAWAFTVSFNQTIGYLEATDCKSINNDSKLPTHLPKHNRFKPFFKIRKISYIKPKHNTIN